MKGFLTHDLLTEVHVLHGFGTIAAKEVSGLLRPRQVHGTRVAIIDRAAQNAGEADAILSTLPGVCIGIVTADCVPVLFADVSGKVVAAAHAGWRGLAAGVMEQTLHAFSDLGVDANKLRAVIGPHIGPCCYEVDTPVLDAMRKRFPDWQAAVHMRDASRSEHVQLDLGLLAVQELSRFGLDRQCIGRISDACTACNPTRFYSYRRDGAGTGRLVHFIAAANET